jgi:hypothetical protein
MKSMAMNDPSTHYDLIVVGSSHGCSSLAHRLAASSKRILILERGDYLLRGNPELEFERGFRARPLPGARDLVHRRGPSLRAGPALLRRRQLQGLLRGIAAVTQAGFRRGGACRRRLSRLPLGILLEEHDSRPTRTSRHIRCDAFDGFQCPLDAKADAQVACIDPMLREHAQQHGGPPPTAG